VFFLDRLNRGDMLIEVPPDQHLMIYSKLILLVSFFLVSGT
jgi:hypothetical protein